MVKHSEVVQNKNICTKHEPEINRFYIYQYISNRLLLYATTLYFNYINFKMKVIACVI